MFMPFLVNMISRLRARLRLLGLGAQPINSDQRSVHICLLRVQLRPGLHCPLAAAGTQWLPAKSPPLGWRGRAGGLAEDGALSLCINQGWLQGCARRARQEGFQWSRGLANWCSCLVQAFSFPAENLGVLAIFMALKLISAFFFSFFSRICLAATTFSPHTHPLFFQTGSFQQVKVCRGGSEI